MHSLVDETGAKTMIDTRRPGEPPAADLSVGVVVIGRNEGERLIACLRSLAPLGLPVTYVDSASTDGSREAARAAGADVVGLDLTRPFTAARARNEGAAALLRRAPTLRYIQFVDGDCTVVAGWIPVAARFLDENPGYAVACGQRREEFPDRSLYNHICNDEWNTPVGEAQACGGDALVRATAFQAVGGFDPAMVANEEPEFCARLRAQGDKIFRLDAPMTMHDANILRLQPWWRRNVRAGFGYAQTLVRHPSLRSAEAAMLRRAVIWSSLPVLALALMLAGRPLLAGAVLMLYPLQIARIAYRRIRAKQLFGWRAAGLTTLGKFAELSGALQFAWDAARRKRRGAMLYR